MERNYYPKYERKTPYNLVDQFERDSIGEETGDLEPTDSIIKIREDKYHLFLEMFFSSKD